MSFRYTKRFVQGGGYGRSDRDEFQNPRLLKDMEAHSILPWSPLCDYQYIDNEPHCCVHEGVFYTSRDASGPSFAVGAVPPNDPVSGHLYWNVFAGGGGSVTGSTYLGKYKFGSREEYARADFTIDYPPGVPTPAGIILNPGDTWWDNGHQQLYIWNGSSWDLSPTQPTALPSNYFIVEHYVTTVYDRPIFAGEGKAIVVRNGATSTWDIHPLDYMGGPGWATDRVIGNRQVGATGVSSETYLDANMPTEAETWFNQSLQGWLQKITNNLLWIKANMFSGVLPNTDFYVNYTSGTDDTSPGRGFSPLNAWQTVPYAIQQIESMNTIEGARLNIYVAGGSGPFMPSSYGTRISPRKKFLINGWNVAVDVSGSTPNYVISIDGGDIEFTSCTFRTMKPMSGATNYALMEAMIAVSNATVKLYKCNIVTPLAIGLLNASTVVRVRGMQSNYLEQDCTYDLNLISCTQWDFREQCTGLVVSPTYASAVSTPNIDMSIGGYLMRLEGQSKVRFMGKYLFPPITGQAFILDTQSMLMGASMLPPTTVPGAALAPISNIYP